MTEQDKKPDESGAEQERLQYRAAMRYKQALDARKDFLSFVRHTLPDPDDFENPVASRYKVEAHHRLLAEALQEVAEGKCLRLIISMPPQHGKSELASRRFPSWFMGKYPFRNLMHGTYNQDFADNFGEEVRGIMEQSEYAQVFPKTEFRKGSRSKDHMVTTQGGKLTFLGRGGAGTGKPADIFIIDDPIKDAKEAESGTIRNDVWEWFTKVAFTRCHVLSAIIIIMTRWHEDDLVGRLTDSTNAFYNEEVAKSYTVINIPAEIDDERLAKALGKKVGDALWEERFPLQHLRTARLMNPLAYSALYMGRPTPPEGAFYKRDMFKGYNSLSELPNNLRYYGTTDLAVSPDKNRDKSVILNWGLDEFDELWLLPDIYWEQKAADESVEKIWQFGKQYGWFDFWGEKGMIDRAISPFLKKRMEEEGVYFNVNAFPTTGSKGHRSIAMRGRCSQGKVHVPKFASWWHQAQDQLLKFTGSGDDKEDDFCDAFALMGQALNTMVKATKERTSEKVVQIGSLAWIKDATRREQQIMKKRKHSGGF
jgi:predicted phage terminase large subunit-like protein